jgi:hypothetical protein
MHSAPILRRMGLKILYMYIYSEVRAVTTTFWGKDWIHSNNLRFSFEMKAQRKSTYGRIHWPTLRPPEELTHGMSEPFTLLERLHRSWKKCRDIAWILEISECWWTSTGKMSTNTGETIIHSRRSDNHHSNGVVIAMPKEASKSLNERPTKNSKILV